ncbi:hypothetical protein GCM10010361_28980 [Streptomyces olivaceiscleroticus]|uniref:Uncharacterized protein n=1 Tax=Streptomyces olivaceiscleroticus TaxID=68245 RepID=A0ABN0ZYL4_9ACTN
MPRGAPDKADLAMGPCGRGAGDTDVLPCQATDLPHSAACDGVRPTRTTRSTRHRPKCRLRDFSTSLAHGTLGWADAHWPGSLGTFPSGPDWRRDGFAGCCPARVWVTRNGARVRQYASDAVSTLDADADDDVSDA